MTTFVLSKCKIDKRVILDQAQHGEVICTIDGTEISKKVKGEKVIIKSAWLDAREKVKEEKLFRIDGRGWFESIDDAFPKKGGACQIQ